MLRCWGATVLLILASSFNLFVGCRAGAPEVDPDVPETPAVGAPVAKTPITETPAPADPPAPTEADASRPGPWLPLFDGISLAGWEPISFGGEGEVRADPRGEMELRQGSPLTGIRWAADPRELLGPSLEHYEIRLQARRTRGSDFFVGLTFPVGDAGHVTLVCGGWGGSLVGISCLDGLDASENPTTSFRRFESGRWYSVRVRVTPTELRAWIDDDEVAIVDRSAHERFSLRTEVLSTAPLGLCCYLTDVAYRAIEVRRLGPRAHEAALPDPGDGR